MNQLFPITILLAFVVLLLQAPIFSFADSVPPQLREVIETSPQALALKALHASLSFDLGSSNDFSPVEDFSDCSRSELKTNNLVALNFLANRYAAPHTFEVQLSLNPFLLQFFENSQMIKSSACRHKNIENFLKAAVIYQLARTYDQIRFHPK